MMRFLLLMLTVLWAAPAHADCSGPAGKRGALMYNDTYDVVQVCTGTNWNALGGGGGDTMPEGAIMAFDLAACPTGWSEYTAARGRFLRGIDNGAGNDPSGTRAPGNVQADDFKSHSHVQTGSGIGSLNQTPLGGGSVGGTTSQLSTMPTGGSETRPKNVAVLFCRKN